MDESWICQQCRNVTAARKDDEQMFVSWRKCPVCDKMTHHKTIIPDLTPVLRAQNAR